MRVGIDAHKMKCTTVMFDGDSVTGSFDFQTTRQGVYEFMEKVPEGSVAVIESSTTGKVLSRMLSGKYEVHMRMHGRRYILPFIQTGYNMLVSIDR